jgi:hypothetical protein
MPSIGEIANQARALLEKIDANTAATKNNTASTDNHVVQLINVSQNGFTNLSQGIALQIIIQKQANELLLHNVKQNETIICWLKTIAEELCEIYRNTKEEVNLQNNINYTLTHLNRILELVHSKETLEILSRETIEAKMEKCCPEKPEVEKPCFTECRNPEALKVGQVDSKWKPLTSDKIK